MNQRGVPGVLGAVVRGSADERLFLSCRHVLFGRGARAGEPIWAVDDAQPGRSFAEIGRTMRGEIGQVTHDGRHLFVDAALGSLHDDTRLPGFVRRVLELIPITGVATVERGQRVMKDAPITGRTYGRVVDTQYFDRPFIDGRSFDAPGQILIRCDDPERCFSAAGESGAAILDEAGGVVGFLWGSNANGEGVAFPAVAALEHLGVSLDLPARTARCEHQVTVG